MRLHEGRDRLMEMNSFRPKVAEKIVEEIRREDADTGARRVHAVHV